MTIYPSFDLKMVIDPDFDIFARINAAYLKRYPEHMKANIIVDR
jgi:hypothetical protein